MYKVKKTLVIEIDLKRRRGVSSRRETKTKGAGG